MKLSRARSSRAFTLVELMVAIAIFMMLMSAVYATWGVVMRAMQVGQAAAARAQRQRVTLRTLENSLMCIQSYQASQKYYSFNVVSGDEPVLSFASKLPEGFPRNGKFQPFDLRRVTFSLEPGPDQSKNLVLRQNPILMDMDQDEKDYPLILAKDVKTFLVECWDTNQLEWVTEWDNTNAIPPMLLISLVFAGGGGSVNSASDYSVVRCFSMPSSEMPQVVQTGSGGGPSGPGGNAGNVGQQLLNGLNKPH